MINVINNLSPNAKIYANCSYLFYRAELDNESISFSGEVERLIFVASGSLDLKGHKLTVGDSVELKSKTIELTGSGIIYVAQSAVALHDPSQLCRITRAGSHYRVVKPWGFELWLNRDSPRFCAKRIFIKAGTQTSLQYHNFKEETNLVESGEVGLVRQANASVPIELATEESMVEGSFTGPICFHIPPKTLHRLRARSDLWLFEVSTPQLDDVVRVQDDAGRPSGRIEQEHSA